VRHELKNMEDRLAVVDAETEKVKRRFDDAEARWKAIGGVVVLEEKIAAAKKMLVWANVAEKARGRDALEKKLKGARDDALASSERIGKIAKAKADLAAKEGAATKALEAALAGTEARRAALEAKEVEVEALEAALKAATLARSKAAEAAKGKAAAVKRAEDALTRLRRELEDKRAASRMEQARASRATAQERHAAATADLAAAREKAEEAEGTARGAEARANAAAAALRAARDSAKAARDALLRLEATASGGGAGGARRGGAAAAAAAANDPLAPFRASPFFAPVAGIADAIAANRARFSVPPIGPLGATVRVKEAAWVGIVEAIWRGKDKFVVASVEDARVLESLAAGLGASNRLQ
jgi:chromosome segregation ATPase